MSILLNGDCLELLDTIEDNSVDFIFCDLPYATGKFGKCVSCEWDKPIDLDKLWDKLMKKKKINTPIFMSCNVKLGYELMRTAPKKCPFRYDLIWVKSSPAGFLNAKKMPMRKHELIYVFYEKLPMYDLSSHKHKFLKEGNESQEKTQISKSKDKDLYGDQKGGTIGNVHGTNYDPPLPESVIKGENNTYNTEGRKKPITREPAGKYDPPLPDSVIKEDIRKDKHNTAYGDNIHYHNNNQKNGESIYNPPLPNSVIKEDCYNYKERIENGNLYKNPRHLQKGDDPIYDPPLPNSVIKEDCYNYKDRVNNGKLKETGNAQFEGANGQPLYEPPLPNSLLEVKSTRGKHSTEKPVDLIKWLLKYYSKEGDIVLDPTMGSGSTGVACKEMKRDFIGIEMNPEIYEVAVNRIEV